MSSKTKSCGTSIENLRMVHAVLLETTKASQIEPRLVLDHLLQQGHYQFFQILAYLWLHWLVFGSLLALLSSPFLSSSLLVLSALVCMVIA